MTYQIEDFRDDPDHDEQQIRDLAVAGNLNATSLPNNRNRRKTVRQLIAERRLAVRSIRVEYGPQVELEDAFDEILDGARLLRKAKLPQPAVHLLAESFSGKSVGAISYVQKRAKCGSEHDGITPVAYCRIDTDGTIGSVAADILKALGEKRPDALAPDKRWDRARHAIRSHGVSLLIFDEFQRAGRRPTISPSIAGKILDIMDSGDCGVAFLGKRDAINVFKSCPDLMNRLDAPVQIPPLRWATDREEFVAFADAFDQALVDANITKFKSGLGEWATAQRLLEASNGLIGQFSRIVETAVIMITRDGNDAITQDDLRDAVQEWSIGNQRISYNPFVTSLSDMDATENTSPTGSSFEEFGKAKFSSGPRRRAANGSNHGEGEL
ncbi:MULTISPECIES: TniB family NTP-binding protein [Sphingopyxis]|uniref:TniB family NTP-binding protein n=1 Tax=Sphingopyxis TaxID=165697 RepID=UPI0006C5551B|nr:MULTISPECIES: TniB family NTP-binding protein [Sphingopyxis]GAO77207.1 hypothetical protein SC1_00497 [Sphingopyxis sp. C-1]